MILPLTLPDEIERIKALNNLKIEKTTPEERFDRITRLAQRLFGTSYAVISLLGSKRHWLKSRQGVELTEIPSEVSFCAHALLEQEIMVVPNTTEDERFFDNPLVTGPLQIRFYAGCPIKSPDGYKVGMLCIADTKPRNLEESDLQGLRDLANLAQSELYRIELAQELRIRKELEKNLKFLKSVLINSNDSIIITDCSQGKNIIVFVNQAFCNITGYSLEEVLGKPPTLLQGPNSSPEALDKIQQILRSKKTGLVEIINYHKNGTEFWNELSLVPIFDDSNNLTNWVSIQRDITQSKIAEQAMAENEERFRTLIQNLQIGVLVQSSPNAEILLCNPASLQLLGISENQLMGKSSYDPDWNVIHEDGSPFPNVTHPVPVALTTGKSVKDVIMGVYRPTMGDRVWLLVQAEPQFDSEGNITKVICTFSDITKHKQAEEALATEKNLLAVTIESAGDAIITTDIKGNIILFNRIASQLTAWSQEEATGQPLNQILNLTINKNREPISDPYERALVNGRLANPEQKLMLKGRDGNYRSIVSSVSIVKDKNNNTVGIVLAIHDITEEQRVTEELLEAGRLESLGVLAEGIAHDFNNLLTTILGNLSLAKYFLASGNDIFNLLEEVEKASLRAKDLTHHLLSFTKGGDPLKKPSLINDIIRDSVRFVLRDSKITGRLEIDDNLWPIEVDEGQLSQVIQNLLLNAAQAMPEGGVVLVKGTNIHLQTGEVSALPPGRYVQLTIKDQGIGIQQKDLPWIFDPYYTTKKTGNGLGLAICHSIVTKHGGLITVESEPGIGTIFNIYFPATLRAVEINMKLTGSLKMGHGKVLIMDDELSIRVFTGVLLEKLGYQVEMVREGGEAIEIYKKAKAAGVPFDVILMDLTVPGGLGAQETLDRLRKFDPAVRTVVSSGYSTNPVITNYADFGFNGAVCKPYQSKELVKVLQQVIDS
jgi:PAS domain S-box-containing protein